MFVKKRRRLHTNMDSVDCPTLSVFFVISFCFFPNFLIFTSSLSVLFLILLSFFWFPVPCHLDILGGRRVRARSGRTKSGNKSGTNAVWRRTLHSAPRSSFNAVLLIQCCALNSALCSWCSAALTLDSALYVLLIQRCMYSWFSAVCTLDSALYVLLIQRCMCSWFSAVCALDSAL